MRLTICLTAAVALIAWSNQGQAQPAGSNAMPPPAQPAGPVPPASQPTLPDAQPTTAQPAFAQPAFPDAQTAAKAAAFQLNGTTWTFTDKKGVKVQESIDDKGNYVATSADGKQLDHGTSVMKGDKACFTSAVDKQGEVCWTTKAVEIGQAMDTMSDKGEKLTVTRVDYVPAAKPK
jgi:hypothetical protein